MSKSNKKHKRIYMDYSASAKPNPSSIHDEGILAMKKLNQSRKKVSEILSSQPEEIIFTSGGTESNNLAIQGLIWRVLELSSYHLIKELIYSISQSLNAISKGKKELKYSLPHIITTNIEHPSVLETVRMLARRKLVDVSIIPVEGNGIVDVKKIVNEINENTVLISVMYANNEIGTIQPIKEIAKQIRHWRKVHNPNSNFPVFHTDAIQAVNYLDLNVEKLGIDMLSISGSKISGAGRVGVLYKKKSVPFSPILGGGGQEHGLRPGTEDLEGIIKFTRSFQKTQLEKGKETRRLILLRDYFLTEIKKIIPDVIINGDLKNRLPNNVNITIPRIPSDLLVIELSAKGIMISEKSACKSGDKKMSSVIEAIRKKGNKSFYKEEFFGSLRFSFGAQTRKSDIDYTLKSIFLIYKKLKLWYK